MSIRNHFIFWSLSVLGLAAFIYLFKAVLLPFTMGFAVAYLLNPMVGAMGKLKIGRSPAALMILGGFILIVSVIMAVVSPIIYRQLLQLMQDFPGYVDQIMLAVEPLSQKVLALLGLENGTDIRAILKEHGASAFGVAAKLAGGLAEGGQAALDIIFVIVLMPIVAYYMMKEWLHISEWVQEMLPRDHKGTIMELLKQIDEKLSGFIRGQLSVALFLGVAYALALSLAGLKYGFLIGIAAGMLSVIPMVGSAIGLIVSVVVAWFQAGDLMYVALIAGIFLGGQIIEGNFLTPKLVGESVGMHPLWVFFALLAGGSLFGILGMLIAVPVAAVAGVLLAFAITQYKKSVYFFGAQKPAEETSSGAPEDGA